MRKLLVAFVASLSLLSCSKEAKKFVTISGQINNREIKNLTIKGNKVLKTIKVNENGSFKDTLHIDKGMFLIAVGNERETLFLENGYNLTLKFKGKTLSEGIDFSGEGAETNNYLSEKKAFFRSNLGDPKSYFVLDESEFENQIKSAKEKLEAIKTNYNNVDSLVWQMDQRNDKMYLNYLTSNYKERHSAAVKLAKGKVSPQFNNYENYKGGTTSLSDLKGKYVYIDVWATWCGPCKREIPFLKKLEKDFEGKNVQFVSISIDDPKNHEVWKKMVADKQMSGIQLFAGNNFNADFVKEYDINSIPRFIIIDPNGNIFDANASRPSNPDTKKLLASLVQ
ncbi:MAG: TlpA family protein disulfide reductase [Lutibacter sp.]